MFYKIFFSTSKLYTYLLRKKFNHFGKGSIIKPFLNSVNEQLISIGENVNIGSFCRLTVTTEFAGVKCGKSKGIRLKIGNNVDIGNNSFISVNNNVEIGDDVIASAYVFITDHDHGFADVEKDLHQQPLTDKGYVKIGDNVLLGVKCSILKNVTIGRRSIVAANAVVVKDVPPYSVVAGNPARVIKKYDFEQKKWIRVK